MKNRANITANITNITEKANITDDNLNNHINSFLTFILNNKSKKIANSDTSDEFLKSIKDLFDNLHSNYLGLNITNPFSTVITDTQNSQSQNSRDQSLITDTQTAETLASLNRSAVNVDSSFNFSEFYDKLETSLISKIDETIQNRVTHELEKHLGLRKNLTSHQIKEELDKLSLTFQSILKKKNQIKLLESHLNNKTTPKELKHFNFPHPFQAFDHKTLFINKYNAIIENTQEEIMKLEISEFNTDIELLENDVKVFCEILRYHVKDFSTTKEKIYAQQEESLKKNFNSSSIKVSKATSSPFKINENKDKYVYKKDNNNNNNKSKPKKKSNNNNNNNKIYNDKQSNDKIINNNNKTVTKNNTNDRHIKEKRQHNQNQKQYDVNNFSSLNNFNNNSLYNNNNPRSSMFPTNYYLPSFNQNNLNSNNFPNNLNNNNTHYFQNRSINPSKS